MSVLRIGSVRLNVHEGGIPDGPAVLFHHSLGGNAGLWSRQARILENRYRTVRYDCRGHGRSSPSEVPLSIERLGKDALDLMDQLGISEAAFCGLSLGSMVGLWLGAHAPHRIRRMLLAGASAYVEDKQAFDSRISRLRDGDLSREIPELLARWFTPAFLAGYPREISGVEAMVKATPLAGYIAAAMAVRDFDGREALSQIRCPVLLITGRGDLATPPRQAELIAERVPTARINVIENASHLAQEEKPDEFDQLLRDFYGI